MTIVVFMALYLNLDDNITQYSRFFPPKLEKREDVRRLNYLIYDLISMFHIFLEGYISLRYNFFIVSLQPILKISQILILCLVCLCSTKNSVNMKKLQNYRLTSESIYYTHERNSGILERTFHSIPAGAGPGLSQWQPDLYKVRQEGLTGQSITDRRTRQTSKVGTYLTYFP